MSVDRSVAGIVSLYVFVVNDDDDLVLTGLDTTKWLVAEDGRSATRTITLDTAGRRSNR